MKVEFEVSFNGNSLAIHNEKFVLEQIREKFRPGFLDATVENPFQWKSSEALGYLYAEIGNKAVHGLREMGYRIDDKKVAIKFIMDKMEGDKWVDVVYDMNGAVVSRTPKSIAGMGKKELSELTEELIEFIQTWFQIDINSPEDYKKLMKTAK